MSTRPAASATSQDSTWGTQPATGIWNTAAWRELGRKPLEQRVGRIAREADVRRQVAELRRLGKVGDARRVTEQVAQRHRVAARVEVGEPPGSAS